MNTHYYDPNQPPKLDTRCYICEAEARRREQRQFLSWPTGAGKTALMMKLLEERADTLSLKTIVLGPRSARLLVFTSQVRRAAKMKRGGDAARVLYRIPSKRRRKYARRFNEELTRRSAVVDRQVLNRKQLKTDTLVFAPGLNHTTTGRFLQEQNRSQRPPPNREIVTWGATLPEVNVPNRNGVSYSQEAIDTMLAHSKRLEDEGIITRSKLDNSAPSVKEQADEADDTDFSLDC